MLPYFEHYLQFNNIKKETLESLVVFMKYKTFKKDSFIFQQGDRKDNFYGLINGLVAIRTQKNVKRKFDSSNNFNFNTTNIDYKYQSTDFGIGKDDQYCKEQEQTLIYPGMCFGEWALIYNTPQNTSSYCIEPVEVLILNKKIFDIFLKKDVIRSDCFKRQLILSTLPVLKDTDNHHILRLLRSIVPCVRIYINIYPS